MVDNEEYSTEFQEAEDPLFPNPRPQRQVPSEKPKPLPQAPPTYYPTTIHQESFFKKAILVILVGILAFGVIWGILTFSGKEFNPKVTNNINVPNITVPVEVHNHYNQTIIVNFDNATIDSLANSLAEKLNITNSS